MNVLDRVRIERAVLATGGWTCAARRGDGAATSGPNSGPAPSS